MARRKTDVGCGAEFRRHLDGEGRTVRLRREMKALLESLRESAAALGSEACFEVLARMMKTGCGS